MKTKATLPQNFLIGEEVAQLSPKHVPPSPAGAHRHVMAQNDLLTVAPDTLVSVFAPDAHPVHFHFKSTGVVMGPAVISYQTLPIPKNSGSSRAAHLTELLIVLAGIFLVAFYVVQFSASFAFVATAALALLFCLACVLPNLSRIRDNRYYTRVVFPLSRPHAS